MINRKILFIGGMFPKELEKEIFDNTIGQPQNAANLLQWNIIRGLEENISEPIDIFSSFFIGAYPLKYKKMIISGGCFNHSNEEKHSDRYLGFLNLPQIKLGSQIFSLKKNIKKYLKFNDCDIIIGYSMTIAIVKSLLYAKKKKKDVKTCLVVPDLPQYMNLGKRKNIIFRIMKKISNKILYSDIKKIDSFVILTEHMAKPLGIENKPYTVVEGIASEDTAKNAFNINCSDIKKFVYTGSLSEKYGIKNLVDAFHKLENDDIQLIICGSGDSVKYIEKMSTKDNRIKYLGVLPQDETRKLQQTAYVLLNPRQSNEEYTKYSFPSKTMEYMLSGRPVLMYSLAGMPEEYNKYLLLIEDTENGLYEALKRTIEMDEEFINNFGSVAKDFIISQKNAKIQTKKILDLTEKLKR